MWRQKMEDFKITHTYTVRKRLAEAIRKPNLKQNRTKQNQPIAISFNDKNVFSVTSS